MDIGEFIVENKIKIPIILVVSIILIVTIIKINKNMTYDLKCLCFTKNESEQIEEYEYIENEVNL